MNEKNGNPSQEEDRYISTIELARRTDVNTRTIGSWMRKNKIPFEKIGRTVRFHWETFAIIFPAQAAPRCSIMSRIYFLVCATDCAIWPIRYEKSIVETEDFAAPQMVHLWEFHPLN
jgi:excisionase family DNA binding protein